MQRPEDGASMMESRFFQVRLKSSKMLFIESNNLNPFLFFTESSICQAWDIRALLPRLRLRDMVHM